MGATTPPVVIVGAGIAGLVAAVELARRGLEVTVLERAATPGGKLRQQHAGDAAIDAGPTVFTMRWVFDEIFAEAGAALEQHLVLTPLDVLARNAWGPGEQLDLHATPLRAADAIGVFAGAREAQAFLAFSAEARRIYATLKQPFLDDAKPDPFTLARRVGLDRIGDLMAIRPFHTLWRALSEHFTDARLRQLFARYATYNGSSPFMAPATLMLIAHVEQDGVWLVDGGMHRLAVALESLASLHGAQIRYGAHVCDINQEGGRAAAVTLASGERIPAAAVVINADPAALATGAFGNWARRACGAPRRGARSLSAVTWTANATARGFPLHRHNVFFGGDYRREFEDLFVHRRVPFDPTVYVCAQDRDGDDRRRGGEERFLVLVNAPADGDIHVMDPVERHACQTIVFDRLRRSGLIIDADETSMTMTTPSDFDGLFPRTGGALYGRATHGWPASFLRPGARTRRTGLYLAGGATHPGAGVPMAALSGRIAARTVIADLASRRLFHRVVMPGGTSTASAMTADMA